MKYNQIQLGRNLIELGWFKTQQLIAIQSITDKMEMYDDISELMLVPVSIATWEAAEPISLFESVTTAINSFMAHTQQFKALQKKISTEEELHSMDFHPEIMKVLECLGISVNPDISETFGITNPSYSTRMTTYQVESEVLLLIAMEELNTLKKIKDAVELYN
jgi:hypothetical protein